MLGRVGCRVADCCRVASASCRGKTNFSTAPAPAAAEAIEALQHVSEAERRRAREGRLDRSKVHNNNNNNNNRGLIFIFRIWEQD